MTKAATRRLGERVVGLVEGGEPRAGCEWIEVLASGSSRMEIIQRAPDLGVWRPSISSRVPSVADAEAATKDPMGFVWRIAGNPDWRSSVDFLSTFPGMPR
jgi:hypothetical protein